MSSSCFVSALYYYPIKSLQGISVERATVDDFGIQYDRRFMLIDDDNKFITQRSHPKLSQLKVSVDYSVEGELVLYIVSEAFGSLQFSIEQFKGSAVTIANVYVWKDVVESLILENEATKRLSDYLGLHVRLAYMSGSSFRQVDREFYSEDKRVSFADGYPFLLTSEASLADLNSRLKQTVPMTNFRPNIVISGGISAYAEDVWKRVVIGSLSFELVKPCSRCVMTTINAQGDKSKDKEPLKTLSQYRKNEFGVCFGQNMVHTMKGEIQVGDFVTFE